MPGNSTRNEVMSIDEFTSWLSTAVDWTPPALRAEDHLVDDLGMDSVGAVDLMVALEDAAGDDVVMPLEMILQITTVRDAYLQYCTLAQLPLEGQGTP